MASFVVHYLCGLKMCTFIEEKFSCVLSKAENNEFLLGNFMPDSSRLLFEHFEGTPLEWKEEVQKEKISTHFRNPIRSLYCIQYPSLTLFLSKYGELFYKHLSVLGYFFHLYTDRYFFQDLFPRSFQFLDVSLRPTLVKSRARFVKIFKNNVLYRVNEFWDHGGIYQDYTIMNALLLGQEDFSLDFDSLEIYARDHFVNPGISEVDYFKVGPVLKQTKKYVNESLELESLDLSVFSLEDILNFMDRLVYRFWDDYAFLIEEYFRMK